MCMEDRTIVNLTDTRRKDDRRLRDHLLAMEHVDDNSTFADLDWDEVR